MQKPFADEVNTNTFLDLAPLCRTTITRRDIGPFVDLLFMPLREKLVKSNNERKQSSLQDNIYNQNVHKMH